MKITAATDTTALTKAQKDAAARIGISERFFALLAARGMSAEEMKKFLSPSVDDMSPPFDIDGMREAADRIRLALSRKERILIFGDYDCDGICAISVLMLALRDKTDVFYFIPDRRRDGYGMTVDALKGVLAARRPDLVITVDCGITSVKEVEYLRSEGVDVIVTDHHEPQDEIPDCIVVDPKIARRGFYDYCGAGVALKLTEALFGRAEAVKYLDIAAIATIADVVPLAGDNRIIAYYGLKDIKKHPRKGIRILLGKEDADSHEIMFKLAPKINAAGRLGSAMKAVDLFLEEDYFLLKSLAEELGRDNDRRKELCEKVVADAKAMLRGIDMDSTRLIALASPEWEAGVLGIAAARLSEEFRCPSVLFTDKDGVLKGSARSVPAVNIFELFSRFSDSFISFGGHAQAAGVSMMGDKLNDFRSAANDYLVRAHACEDFLPRTECDMILDKDTDLLAFAKELQLLEPTGYGNPRPSFLLEESALDFESIGFTPHIKASAGCCDILGFSRFAHHIGAGRGRVQLEINLGVSEFQNNVSAEGVIRSVNVLSAALKDTDAGMNALHQLRYEGSAELCEISGKELEDALSRPFGTLVVCFTQDDYDRLKEAVPKVGDVGINIAYTRCLCPETAVVIAPAPSFDYGYYRRVVVAGRPLTEGYLAHIKNTSVSAYRIGDVSPKRLQVTLPQMRAVFNALRELSLRHERVLSPARLYGAVRDKVRLPQVEFFAVLDMLKETGLIFVTDRGMINVSNKKTDLSRSVIYRNIVKE